MRAFVAGSVLLAAILCGGAAWGDARAWELVWRSETAKERAAVVGQVRTTLADDGASVSATAEARVAQGKTRFDYQTRRREWSLIDDGELLIELDARRKEAHVYERPRLVVDRPLAERNYDAREAGTAVLAGRQAVEVAVTPKLGGAAVLRLWLDKETGFALKRERYNVDGKLVSSTEYVEVSFGEIVGGDVFTVPAGYEIDRSAQPAGKLGLKQLGDRIGFAVRLPAYLPPGYVLLGGYQAEWGRREHPKAELRYTDGIRMLSVFERKRGMEPSERERHGGRSGGRPDRRGREHDRGGGGHGRGGRGGRDGRHRPGPPAEETSVVDRGYEKALRYFGPAIVVLVVGDVGEEDLRRIAYSVPQQ